MIAPSDARADDGTWVTVGAADFSAGDADYTSLAFNPSTNQAYVAYGDSANDGKVTVMRFDGTNWVTVGAAGFSEGWVGHLSLAFSLSTSQPYVAYGSGNNPGGKVTVKRFDGTNWVTVGAAGFSEGEADYASLAFDLATSQPYVAYRDRSNDYSATVMRFDGTNWVTVGAAGFSASQATHISLVFDPHTDEPYVAYRDIAEGGRATVMRFDGTNWVTVGAAGFSAISAYDTSLAFDLATSQPYVAYDYFPANVMKFEAFQQPPLAPKIARAETFREGVFVFFRLFFSDPNNDATGFGFRGSGWAEETHPFSDPSYGRVFPGRVEYPFNLQCGTGSDYESDVEAWIYDSTGLRSPSLTVHLACSASE